MNNPRLTLLAVCLLLAACHARQASIPPSAAVSVAAPAATTELILSSRPLSRGENVLSLFTVSPVKSGSAVPVQTTAPATQAPAAQAALPAQPALQPADEPATVTAPVFPPDQAAFAGEDLLDVSGRLLSPDSYKTPSRNAEQTYNAPWKGEQLKYGVYYAFVKAGTAYIKNRGITQVGGRDAYVLQTTAFSASVIDAVFKVRDINISWLDAQTFHSLGYTQSVREGNYVRDEWLKFDYPNQQFSGQIRKKDAPRPLTGPLPAPVLDVLSSLYYVRSQPLVPGQDIVFDIVNREKTYPLVVKVTGKERVKTAAGTFDTIIVEPQLRGDGIFIQKGKSLKVWLTDDAYKMPVKMKTEVFIGSVSAELLEYKRN